MKLCNLPFPRASRIKQPGRSGHSPIEPLFPQFRNSCRLAGSNCRYGIKTWKVFRAANRSPAERSFHPFPGGGPGVFRSGRVRPVGILDPFNNSVFSSASLFSSLLAFARRPLYLLGSAAQTASAPENNPTRTVPNRIIAPYSRPWLAGIKTRRRCSADSICRIGRFLRPE